MNLHKPGNGPRKINTDRPSPSGNPGKVGPMLVPHILNFAKKPKRITNMVIRRIIRVIINYNIDPIWGRGRGDNSHLNTTHIQLTPQLSQFTGNLTFKRNPSNLISTLLDTEYLRTSGREKIHNGFSDITIWSPLSKIINLQIRRSGHIIRVNHDQENNHPDGRGTQPDG